MTRGLCLGGCGAPRRWPWTFCGRLACHHTAAIRLGQIRDAAGVPPWDRRPGFKRNGDPLK